MTTNDPQPPPLPGVPGAAAAVPRLSFAYRAQLLDGMPLSGTIDAAGHDDARRQLEALNLRVLDIEGGKAPAPRGGAIRGEDFIAFNQQLAQLTAAGMPIEQGLRLIAQDMRRGRLAATVRAIADDLERGVPLGEAFDRRRGQLPSLYGRLIEAGVRSNNLPAMLLNLGTHAEAVHRLRGLLWRSVSYPLVVLAGLLAVAAFAGAYVLPGFAAMSQEFGAELPTITVVVLAVTRVLPYVLAAVVALALLAPVAWWVLRRRGAEQAAADRLFLPLPLVGPALKRNRVARWCDAVRLGVEAGLDLPAAVGLAGDAVGSPLLRRDGDDLVRGLQAGGALDGAANYRLLPPTVPAAMGLAVHRNQLAETLATLAAMYQQQAEHRMAMIPAVLMPFLLALVALLIGLLIAALFAPMAEMLRVLGRF